VSFAARAAARVLSLAVALATLGLLSPVAGGEASLAGLADRYRRGDREGALDEIGPWTAEWTEREVENLLRRRPFDPALASAAVLLHAHRRLNASSTTAR
jgi:hypothetical protein